MSEKKQLNLFNLPGNTLTSDVPLQESSKSETTGQTRTKLYNNKVKKREYVRERKRKLVAYKGGKCERCKEEYHPNVFDFHHHDHTQKEFGVDQSQMSKAWDILVDEVDKCHLLCSNCHREVHTYHPAKFIKL